MRWSGIVGAAVEKLHAVVRLILHPVGEEMVREPGAPLDLQHLQEIQPVHRGDDPDEREQREHAELSEKFGFVAVLEGVVELAVPVVELHFEPDHHQREPDHRAEQRERLGALARHPVRLREGPESP